MGMIRLPSLMNNVKQILRAKSYSHELVPKGHVAVYVGEQMGKKRYICGAVVVLEPSFLLKRAEDEFGFNHPMGGLTIPCREETFLDLISSHQLKGIN